MRILSIVARLRSILSQRHRRIEPHAAPGGHEGRSDRDRGQDRGGQSEQARVPAAAARDQRAPSAMRRPRAGGLTKRPTATAPSAGPATARRTSAARAQRQPHTDLARLARRAHGDPRRRCGRQQRPRQREPGEQRPGSAAGRASFASASVTHRRLHRQLRVGGEERPAQERRRHHRVPGRADQERHRRRTPSPPRCSARGRTASRSRRSSSPASRVSATTPTTVVHSWRSAGASGGGRSRPAGPVAARERLAHDRDRRRALAVRRLELASGRSRAPVVQVPGPCGGSARSPNRRARTVPDSTIIRHARCAREAALPVEAATTPGAPSS